MTIEEKVAVCVGAALRALQAEIGALADNVVEAEGFLRDLDVLEQQAAEHAGVIPVYSTLARMARRLRDAAEGQAQGERVARLVRLERAMMRLRDTWATWVATPRGA